MKKSSETSLHLVRHRREATAFRTEADVNAIADRLEYGRYGDRRSLSRITEGELTFLSLCPCPGHDSSFYIKVVNGTPFLENNAHE